MKFSIEKVDIQKNIQHLNTIIPSKNTMPILTNFLIVADEETNTLQFTATDLEITIIVEMTASITQGGKIAVSAKNFNDMINVMPDKMVHFVVEEEVLNVQCHYSKYQLNCTDTSQYPLRPPKDLSNATEIDASLFKKMIQNTHFAVSTDMNRPIFTGICWKIHPQNQMMIATDGKKIAEFTMFKPFEIQEEIEPILPTKGLLFLDKVISDESPTIMVQIESNRVMFEYQNFTVYTHLIEGRFPDYTKAIPQNNNNILRMNKNDLKNAIKRVSLLASEDTFRVKFDLTEERFSIHSVRREEGEADDRVESYHYQGEPIVIAFNYRFLTAILSAIETEDVEIRMGKPSEPALIFNTETKDEYHVRFLLMPLRLG